MAKDTKKSKNEKETKYDVSFFLNDIVKSMKQSEGIYNNELHLTASICSLTMLFDKNNINDKMVGKEITLEDYSKYFEPMAKEKEVDDMLYFMLFGEFKDEK